MGQEIFINYSLYFIVYGFLGWISEVVYTGARSQHFTNRGFLFLPFLPIYGFGGIFIVYFLQPYPTHPIILFIMGFVLTSILEYITSLTLEELFHIKWWDYSKHRFNINGRVSLRNSTIFGLLSVFVILVIQPSINNFITIFPMSTKETVVDLFFLALIIDLYFTLRRLNKLPIRHMKLLNTKNKNMDRESRSLTPDLIGGKYTKTEGSNILLNIILLISILTGIVFMFIININFGLVIAIIFLLILYAVFKNKIAERLPKNNK